ncbi:MAG TPA: hypothetical protein DCM86_03285 [Verrucomicrobiales bacterium]|nr:hypothetical protein [Verrucomicrobiales bacterium]
MNNNHGGRGVITEEVVAVFGEARLLKQDGQIHLIGGTMADRTEALEWMMLFMPEEAVRVRR